MNKKTSNQRLLNFLNNELFKTFNPKDWELVSILIFCKNENLTTFLLPHGAAGAFCF